METAEYGKYVLPEDYRYYLFILQKKQKATQKVIL